MNQKYENIQFVDQQEQEYFAMVQLGNSARQFLQSDVGRYLHGRAKLELEELKERLMDLDPYNPEDRKVMAQLQRDAYGARKFIRWCVDVISDGDNAGYNLETYREGM